MEEKFVERLVKICALSRISNLDLKQEKNFFKETIRSQFSYCQLIWMFSLRKSNNLLSKVHVRSLRTVSGDNHSSLKNLLTKCKETTIDQRNLQVLMTEDYKIINGISPPIMDKFLYYEKIRTTWDIFKKYLMKIEKQ